MGGLSRKLAYINTLRNNDIDPIILDSGDALFEKVKFAGANLPKEQFKAKSFLNGMEEIGCHALNIGEYDLAGGYAFLKDLEKNSKIPFISANLFSTKTGKPAFKPYVTIEKNDLKVGIVGVTDYLSADVKDLYKIDFISEGKKYLAELRENVDILIILVNGNLSNRTVILESFKEADYVYLSRTVMNTRTAAEQKKGLPIFYTSGLNGKYLINITTTILNDSEPILDVSSYEKRIESIIRQLIRLKKTEGNQTIEEKYADSPQILTQIKNYEKQVVDLNNKINSVVNRSECQVVPLPENMDYDKDMQKFVDNILSKVSKDK